MQRFNNRAGFTSKILAFLIFSLIFSFGSSVSFAAVAVDPRCQYSSDFCPPSAPQPPPLALTLYIESISPFTSVRQVAPVSITIPRGVTMKFSVTANVAVDDFVWSGIKKASQTSFDSTAQIFYSSSRVKSLKPSLSASIDGDEMMSSVASGTYTITVTPRKLLTNGDWQVLSDKAKSISVTLTDDQASNLIVTMDNYEGEPIIYPAGKALECHAKTTVLGREAPEYGPLIQWIGGDAPDHGFGSVFTTAYIHKGSYILKAGSSSSTTVTIYEVGSITYDSPFVPHVSYDHPVTFTATTDPPGYESYIPWHVNTKDDRFTRATPSASIGREFTTSFTNTTNDGLMWVRVYAGGKSLFFNSVPSLTDPGPQSVNFGDPITFSLTCTDLDNDFLMMGMTGAPAGATLSPISGRGSLTSVFTWQTDPANPAHWAYIKHPFDVTISCIDVQDPVVTVTITVLNPPTQPKVGNNLDTGTQVPNTEEVKGYEKGKDKDGKVDDIQLNSGQFYLYMTDLVIPGRGLDYRFEREYRSQIEYDGPLGFNWDHNYNMRLNQELDGGGTPTGNMFLVTGLGRKEFYVKNPDGSFTSPAGKYDKLTKNPDGTFVLRDKDGKKYFFSAVRVPINRAFLFAIEDRNHNRLSFTYNAGGQLTQVTDTLGRPIQYVYNADGTLDHITDFFNRTVSFEYDANGNLDSVTSPAVPLGSTSTGNDFPNGKTQKYTYLSSADPDLNHNLLSTTYANETALEPDGPAALTNVYGTNPAKPYEFDKVISQTFGGLNEAAASLGLPPAGGTITYFYEELNPGGNPSDLDLPRNRTTVIDRVGNVAVYEQNILGAHVSYKEYTGRVNPTLDRATLETLIPSNNPSFPPIAKLRPEDPAFFETTYEYNSDGELVRTVSPEGNSIQEIFDRTNPDRFQQGNLIEVHRSAGPRGGDGSGSAIDDIVVKYIYEPVFNQIRYATDPRGFDPDFVPPVNPTDAGIAGIDFDLNGTVSAAERRRTRYTTVNTFDYQEGTIGDINSLFTAESVPSTPALVADLSLGDNSTVDVNGDGVSNQQTGNAIRAEPPVVQLESGGTQTISTLLAYNSRGQILYRIDPDGSKDEFKYYPASNPHGGSNASPDADTIGELGGYLGREIKDTTSSDNSDGVALNISTDYRYDQVGNIISILDGRGVLTQFEVNQLNQVVKVARAADVSVSPESGLIAFSYTVTNFYDHNENLVRVDVENRDGNVPSLDNDSFSTTYVYDILNRRIQMTQEVSDIQDIATGYRYDANENLIQTIEPEGNFHDTIYDERDLVIEKITGADDPAISSTQSMVYDGNRNVTIARDGEDNNGDTFFEETLFIYDGYDRLIYAVDAVGSETISAYDPAGNVLNRVARGRIGGPSPTDNSTASNVDLSRSSSEYDEVNRVFRVDNEWFIPSGVTPARSPILGDGFQTTQTEYDSSSRVTRAANDNGHAATFEYDGLSRLIRTVDALQNEGSVTYDANSNPIRSTSTERRGDNLAFSPEVFITVNRYDSLNRLRFTSDNLNHTRRTAYDSRDNITVTSDAEGPVTENDPQLGLINTSGNTVRHFYDGLGRIVQTIEDLRTNGTGDGNPGLDGPADPNDDPANLDLTNPANLDGKIIETNVWDDNSRLESVSDDKGNTTSYVYDSLNRKITDTFDDLTTNVYEYDRDGNLTGFTDENGSVFTHTYDGINRRIQTDITRAAGLGGTTLRTFEYDGLNRLTLTTDNNEPGTSVDNSQVTYLYDSLSRKIEEDQDGLVVTSDFDGVGNRIQLTYPDNRVLIYTYDNLERMKTVSGVATYSFIGSGRILERAFASGAKLTYLDNSDADIGYDGIKRIVRHRHETSIDGTIADFSYGFNRENMRLFERRLHQPDGVERKGEAYAYDSLYRIQNFNVGTQTVSGLVTSTDTQTSYNLDGVGNRTSTNKDAVVTSYLPNNMNEYDSVGGITNLHDENGNLKDDGVLLFTHDAFNRLIEVRQKSSGLTIAVYGYDASNRRVKKVVTNSGALNGTARFLWDGWQEIEERSGSDAVLAEYVYGSAIDEILTMNRAGQTYYYHDDSLGSIEALTNGAQAIVERTTYDAYGAPQFTDASFNPTGNISSVGNPFLFTAQRLDPETGLYYYRNRYYNSSTGRFIERDPMGYAAGSLGLYEYVGNDAINRTDAMGLDESGQARLDRKSMEQLQLALAAKNMTPEQTQKITDAAVEKAGSGQGELFSTLKSPKPGSGAGNNWWSQIDWIGFIPFYGSWRNMKNDMERADRAVTAFQYDLGSVDGKDIGDEFFAGMSWFVFDSTMLGLDAIGAGELANRFVSPLRTAARNAAVATAIGTEILAPGTKFEKAAKVIEQVGKTIQKSNKVKSTVKEALETTRNMRPPEFPTVKPKPPARPHYTPPKPSYPKGNQPSGGPHGRNIH